MAKVDVLNWSKQKVGSVELPPEVFEQPLNDHVLNEVVRWQLACRRAGTHQAKTRGLVSGGGKKPFKQKGTGNARQGSTRSPVNVKGGVIFPPTPRDYSYQLPKKVRQLGLRVVLSQLLRDGKLVIVDEMTSASGKTKDLAKNLGKLGFKKAVLVDASTDTKFVQAARNLAKFKYLATPGLNVFDLMKYESAILSQQSVAGIMQKCGVKA